MSNELVAAIEPLLAVPVTAWMETSKGAGDSEVLPKVALQIAEALEGLGAGLIGAGESELRVDGVIRWVDSIVRDKPHKAF
jgi:hypothetical protein